MDGAAGGNRATYVTAGQRARQGAAGANRPNLPRAYRTPTGPALAPVSASKLVGPAAWQQAARPEFVAAFAAAGQWIGGDGDVLGRRSRGSSWKAFLTVSVRAALFVLPNKPLQRIWSPQGHRRRIAAPAWRRPDR